MAVGTGDDAARLAVPGVHATGSQGAELEVVHVGRVVDQDGQPGGQLAEQPGGVEPIRVGDDLHDAPVADLEAMAKGAVDHVAAPVLGQTVDVRQLVYQAGSGKNPASDDGVATDELDPEAVVIGTGHTARQTGKDLNAIAADFLATIGDQLRRRNPFTTEVAVHVCGRSVARVAGVDHDH